MALQLLCYVTMQCFSIKDLQGIKVGDIRVLANGDLRIFQKVGKTFQMGQGDYFYVLNKPFGGFTLHIFQKVGKTFQPGSLYVLNKPFGGFTVKYLMDKYSKVLTFCFLRVLQNRVLA